MGDRFYQAQAAYLKECRRQLRAAGLKKDIISDILDLSVDSDIRVLNKTKKPELLDIYNELIKEQNMTTTWTPELKDIVIQEYKDASPTAENSTEILKQIAEDHDLSVNGVRMVLIQAGAHVKKDPAASTAKASAKGGEGAKRVSKEEQLNALKAFLNDAGARVDEELIDKMTGKAAAYVLEVLQAVAKG